MLSRYSRSEKDAQTLYEEEFLTNRNRGNEFYAKVFGQYGDESISELVPHGFAVCLENISILWSTYLLHYRALSAIEKRTRYVKAFDYYRPSNFKTPQSYHDKCKQRISEYNQEYDKTLSRICATVAQNESEKPAIMRVIKARSLDETRDLLPLSTLTSLGIMTNLRSWLNILTKEKVRNDPSIYTEELIIPFTNLFKKYFPTIFSQDKINYLTKAEQVAFSSILKLESAFDLPDKPISPNEIDAFSLRNELDLNTILDYVLYANETERLKKTKPLRETELLDLTISIPEVDIATFRDIQRHRYFTIVINKWKNYQSSDNELELLISHIATSIDITIKGNLRQWTHAIELRTQEQGHPNYRRIFQSCAIVFAKQLQTTKEDLFPYADWRSDEEIGLGRLKSENKRGPKEDSQ